MRELTGFMTVVGVALLMVLSSVSAVGATGEPDALPESIASRVSATLGDDFLISGTAAIADDRSPAVAFNSTRNQYPVVWGDDREEVTRGADVYGRRFAANGALIGGEFWISGTAAIGARTSPNVDRIASG